MPVFAHALLRAFLSAGTNVKGGWRVRRLALDPVRCRFPKKLIKSRLSNGQQIWIDPNDLIGRCIFYQGLWEGPIARHFYEAVKPGDVVLDVGANIGQFSLLAAQKVGAGGTVFAVEANPATASLLHQNIAVNGLTNIQVLELAAWDEATTLTLRGGPAENCGAADVVAGAADGGIPVRAVCLDDVVLERVTAVDIVKLDIEGAELRALRGMPRILGEKCPRLIYCEINGGRSNDEHSSRELLAYCERFGYAAEIFTDSGELVPFSALRAADHDGASMVVLSKK